MSRFGPRRLKRPNVTYIPASNSSGKKKQEKEKNEKPKKKEEYPF